MNSINFLDPLIVGFRFYASATMLSQLVFEATFTEELIGLSLDL